MELMEHLEQSYAGTELASFLAELKAEVEVDRQKLKGLMERLQVEESTVRKASAWIAGKLTELKLRLDDSAGGDLHRFESLEALSLGIEGKRLLWLAFAAAATVAPELQLLDYGHLAHRANDQRAKLERHRLEAAKRALLPSA
jgi:hypothetical protein